MGKWNKRDKSKSAFGRINQANSMIDALKNTSIAGLADSIQTLTTNYGLLNNSLEELYQDVSDIGSSYEELLANSNNNSQIMTNINNSINTINQKITTFEQNFSNINQSITSINESINSLNQKVTALQNK